MNGPAGARISAPLTLEQGTGDGEATPGTVFVGVNDVTLRSGDFGLVGAQAWIFGRPRALDCVETLILRTHRSCRYTGKSPRKKLRVED